MTPRSRLLAIAACLAAIPAGDAVAQNQAENQVLVVPFSQRNPQLPHPAHEQARVTLKGIVRNVQNDCNTVRVWWDKNRDGVFNDADGPFNRSRTAATDSVRDIGTTFQVPNVDRDSSFNINVKVQNLCTNAESFGTYRLFVYDFTPSPDPRNWTDEQIEIMTAMAAQESMWYLHRTQRGFGGGLGSEMYAYSGYTNATGITMWMFVINGHLPAYAPGTINRHGHQLPDGWEEENDRRWNADPYAETAVRFMNYVARSSRLYGIGAGEEDNDCGYDRNLNLVRCDRIAGTTDNRGARGRSTNVYLLGLELGGLATVLPAMAGTPLQVGNGDTRGQLWEWYIQQFVDLLGRYQIDGGCSKGGWLYGDHSGNRSCSYSDASTSQWAYIGLESAEIAGGPYDVIVNNRHKYRIADNLINNQRGDGGSAYRSSSGRSDVKLTGGAFVGARWLGIHNFQRGDNTVAFPGQSGFTRDRLRQSYDRYVSYTTTWYNRRRTSGSHGWLDGFWQHGDYLCGNRNAVYEAGRCGNTYTLYSHQKGYRTGSPELEMLGNFDWAHDFNVYYVRAQDRNLNGYSTFGRVYDQYCDRHSVTCRYGSGHLSAAMAGLVLTPTIFTPKPVAIASVNPARVTEGCQGGNAGRVVFDHGDSFHPSSESRIIAYRWDVDASDGVDFDDPDFETPEGNGAIADSFEHTYQRAGVYTATLQVLDNLNQTKTTTVTVRVDEAENVAPAAAHGGPYVIEVGGDLQLEGNATDGNIGCGDTVNAAWDLDNDGAFDDANGATPVVRWGALLDGLQVGEPNRVRIRVRDEAGETAIAETTLTIYPPNPEAAGRANPNPAACEQEVVFDASASSHPNPQRTIAQYQWDVDGRAGFDGGGRLFRYTYEQFGDYNVRLRVTDDLGRSDEVEFEVDVSLGNQRPVARTTAQVYEVLEGDDLVLDGRPSSDPNVNCGDRIVEYAWDVNGDGDFDDQGVDARGARATIPFAVVEQVLDGPADQQNREPSNTVTLRVTDSFGQTATVDVEVLWFLARPDAVVVQRPDPAPINLITGFSNPTLDGRESRSPVPGVNLVQFSWDLDDDGDFEVANQPVVEFVKVFDPVPGPNNIPDTFVRLRVTDDAGRSTIVRYRVNYRVPPTPPTADADPTDPPEREYHILLGEGVTLNASQSFDPDAEDFGDFIEVYRWDLSYDEDDGFQADITRADENGDGNEAEVELTAQQLADLGVDRVADYPVRLQVEDTTALTNEDDTVLHVHPRNPIALVTANPNPASCGERVNLDARNSDHPHPNVEVNGYAWDLDGDGQYDDAQGEVVQHQFNQFTFDGPIEVGLQVTDSNGNVGTSTVAVNVTEGNRAPQAVAGGHRDDDGVVDGPYAIAAGENLALSAAGSAEPDAACGDRIVSYQWDIGNDGAFDAQGASPELTWAQLNALGINGPGRHDVRVRVTDRFGTTADSVATLLVVNGPTAVAEANPNRAGCQQQVEFDGSNSGTDGPDGQGFDIVGYAWDLDGDGAYDDADQATVNRAVVALPDDNGDIRVSAGLRVTDASGRTDTTTVEVVINVQNQPPTADAGGPYATGPVGLGFAGVRLDGRRSSDPNAPCDAIAVYKWDTDNDGLYGTDDIPDDREGAVVENFVNPTWRVNTVDTVRLIVCDANGACSEPDEAEIEILDEAPPQGEVLSPRADQDVCLGGGNFDLDLRVSDPEGDRVTVTVTIGGREAGRQDVNTNANGNPVEVTIPVNANLVPEGRHEIIVTLTDPNGGESTATSGGRITFDRTGPVVNIGAQPADNACYDPNRVPDADVEVEDELDAEASFQQQVIEDGCGRTLRVTARDACGNETIANRAYRLAVPVAVVIDGVEDGALVAQAEIEWAVEGPEQCADSIDATIARDGGQAQPYVEGTLVNEPGSYALIINVANCQGVARQQIVNFSVNRPPVAVPIPDGHPAADADNENAYIVTEGAGLQLDASASRAPEQNDEVAAYRWDLDGDGQFDDAEGQLAAFDTSEDGIFRDLALQVEDSLGATHETAFMVTVTDVDPVADPGGPYVVPQGEALQLDGSGSRPGSAADPIARYIWAWDDGTPNTEGADQARPQHAFARDGVYNVRLTVRDEDSEDSAVVRVEVRDVDPVIEGIDAPEDIVEIMPMAFTVNVEPGAPADPITRIEWDMNNDQEVDYAGADLTTVRHQFREAGDYTVVARVYDGDSNQTTAVNVRVREITLGELVTHIGNTTDEAVNGGRYDARQTRDLRNVPTFVDRGEWGERYERRGNTFLALDGILSGTKRAQVAGVDLGLEHWALGRQMVREISRLEDAILELEGGPAQDDARMQRARAFIESMEDTYEADDFEDDARGDAVGEVVHDGIWDDAYQAYFWLSYAIDPFYQENGYSLPDIADPVTRARAAIPINEALTDALTGLREDLEAYTTAGAAQNDVGPGRQQVLAALETLDEIRDLQRLRVGTVCLEGEVCVTDQQALELELLLIDLVNDMNAIASSGAYTRIWQADLMLTVKFRIELSILRVEFSCGRNSAVSRRARDAQAIGLDFVDQLKYGRALDYYAEDAQRCLLIETYNDCLVPAFPNDNEAIAVPEACEAE